MNRESAPDQRFCELPFPARASGNRSRLPEASCHGGSVLAAAFLLCSVLSVDLHAESLVPPRPDPSLVAAYSLRSISDLPESARGTYVAEGIEVREITRGPGINPRSLQRGFSANTWSNPTHGLTPSRQTAIEQGDYYEFGFVVKEDFEASLAVLDVNLRRSARNAPMFLEWQYSLDGFETPGVPIVAEWLNFDSGEEPSSEFGYFARAAGTPPDSFEPFAYMIDWRTDPEVSEISGQQEGNPMPSLDLSIVEALQEIEAGTEVSFRLYAWGNELTVDSNTFAFGRNVGPILRGEVKTLESHQPGVVYVSAGAPGSTSTGATPLLEMGPLIVAPGLDASTVTRGPGIVPRFLANGLSSNTWTNQVDHDPLLTPSLENAIAQGDYYEFSIAVEPGYRADFRTLDARFRRSSTSAPRHMEWRYSFDGFATPGTTLDSFTYLGRATGDPPDSMEEFEYMTSDVPGQNAGNPMPTLLLTNRNLTGIEGGREVTFRLYAWGNENTSNSNTFAFGRSLNRTSPEGPLPVLKLGIDVARETDLPEAAGTPEPVPGAGGVTEPALLELNVVDPVDEEIEVVFFGRPIPPGRDEDAFTVALLPDTQFYSGELHGGGGDVFNSQTDWVVENHQNINIPFVLHLGDIVQRGDIKGGEPNEREWEIAAEAMYRLEDPDTTGLPEGVPYAMNVGNHDQEPIWDPDGTTEFYNLYFGVDHFGGRSYYGGNYGDDNDNFYMLFETGPFRQSRAGLLGREEGPVGFIVISLEYRQFADAALLEWADGLLKAHPDRRGIIVTHHLMRPGFPGAWSPYGEAIYETLKDNPNLDFMFGAHTTGEGARIDTYNDNTVISTVQNYQGMPDGGSGYLRLLTFRPDRHEVLFNTYSPWLDAHLQHWNNPSTVPYDFGMDIEPFREIGRATVSSGSTVEIPWDKLEADAGYEWYARLNEGARSARTEAFDFHTSPVTYTSWRREFFDDDDLKGDRWADPDEDGYVNYFEFLFGGDPLEPGTLRLPHPSTVLGEGRFEIEYRRIREPLLEWQSEVSEDLIHWVPWQEHDLTIEEAIEDNADGTETVRLEITNPGPALFWRLTVRH